LEGQSSESAATASWQLKQAQQWCMQGQSYTDWPFLLNCLQVVGEVCPEVAQQLGLGPGVLVSPGSGDNAMSALGSGITQ
jgi:xylulokinase